MRAAKSLIRAKSGFGQNMFEYKMMAALLEGNPMRWWLAILFCFLTVPGAMAQGWAEKMFKGGLSHDFGTVARGAQLLHKFPITNIYAVPMEITELKPGCGCITPSYSKKIIEPHETAVIDIRMDSTRFQGPKGVVIRVTVAGGQDYYSSAEIRVSANIRGDIVFNPGEINLGTVAAGQKPTARVEVEYAGKLPWQINELSLGKLPVTGNFKEMYRRPGGVGYEVNITLKDGAAAGTIKDFVYLKTNDPELPLVPLLVTGAVASDVTVSPEILNLTEFAAQEPLNRRVVVRGIRPFSIIRVELPDAEVQTSTLLPSPEGMVQTLGLVIKGEKPGPLRKEVKIHTNLSATPLVLVIEGTVVGP